MKKILLALAVVSMVLPMSAMADDTTVYGQFRYSIADVTDKTETTDGVVATDNTSVLGVKGSYGDDIKAYFHLQTGADSDQDGTAIDQRFFFGGLKGSFGNVKYGLLTNAYKMPGFKMDPLYNTSHLGATAGYSGGGATYGLSGATNGFTDNSLEYTSPKIAGSVTVNVSAYLDDGNDDEHATGAGVTYSANGITAGVQTIQTEDTTLPIDTAAAVPGVTQGEDATRVHVSYKAESFSVGVSYEMLATATTDPTYLFVTGTYGVAENTDIVATIGVVDADATSTVGTNEGTGFTLSVFHGITTNTKVFASYASVELDDNVVVEDNPTALSFGVQHKFSTSN